LKTDKSIHSPPICVGFDAKRYFNNPTGLGNYARWLVNGLLANNQLSIKLFTPKPPISTSNYEIIGATGFWKSFKGLWRVRGINADLLRSKIDVYHGLSNELPFGIHKTGIKTVVTIHDCINLRFPENYKLLDRLIYKHKLRYAQNVANTIVVPSKQTKEDLIHYFKTSESKIKVIPLSVPSIPHFKKETKKPYILCISSFDKRKNLENLVKAYQNINSIPYPLIIAGKMGHQFDTLKKSINKTDSIKLISNPSTEQIHSLYNNAVFCVYPSLFEGFGIPILEAFLHGKTVATSNLSSMPEVGGDAVIYFNPNDPNDMKQAITRLLDDEYRFTLEQQVSNQLAKFDSKLLLAQYYNVYANLVKH
jgi:glycosyltransferase involved in cell wall biosynthesis